MAITSTLGGSGSYVHGTTVYAPGAPKVKTLFTTPAATLNTIFIVYLHQYNDSTNLTISSESKKLIVGPSTPIVVFDETSIANNLTTWHYVGMEIS